MQIKADSNRYERVFAIGLITLSVTCEIPADHHDKTKGFNHAHAYTKP